MNKNQIEELSKALIDSGKIIEAGFIGFKMMSYPNGMSAQQETELRQAFFAGSQHLFSSLMNTLDPEVEPTDAELERLDKIHAELEDFINNFMMKSLPTKGGVQ